MENESVATAPANVIAFVSAAGGTGVTSTAANLACALAGVGRRVLIVDWGSDTPSVGEYLEPFHAGVFDVPQPLADVLGTPSGLGDLETPTVSRFRLPGGAVDVLSMVGEDGTDRYPLVREDPTTMAALRTRLPRAGYDHVLIDAPTAGPDQRTLQAIATLCEVAVVCFRPRPRAIQDAAQLATWLRRHAPIGIDLVPVATAFDTSYPARTVRIRDAIRIAFAEVAGPAIELPNRPFETFDPLLAILAEEPTDPVSPLHEGYWRLARAVTNVAPADLAPVSAGFRGRYRRVFGLTAPADSGLVLVAYAPADRPWADWAMALLTRSGARTARFADHNGGETAGVVVIQSSGFTESAAHDALRAYLADTGATPLWLVLDGEPPAEPALRKDDPALVTKLLAHFELIDRPRTEASQGLRLPGDRPAVFTLPPRHPHFVGRDTDMETLRDRFAGRGEGRVVTTIGGVPGVGKSELALEYAHRFAGDYDLIWWVPAGDEQAVLVSLAGLAGRLDPTGDRHYGTTAGLERLADHPEHRRFLIVYDNVADPATIGDLLPGAHRGHVIITSSEATTVDLDLDAMTEAESVALLSDRVPGIEPAHAIEAAAATHHLPIAVELAGAWLAATAQAERTAGASVADAAAWAVRSLLNRLEEQDGGDDMARMVAVVTATLRESPVGRLAIALTELSAFLSQDGISLALVHSDAMFRQLIAICGADARELLTDATEIDRALWHGVRYGLFRVDWGERNLLRVHRIVQQAVRARLPGPTGDARRGGALAALAAFAPSEVEESAGWADGRFTELQKHIFPSGAVDSDDTAVRRWLVNQVRFLFSSGGAGVHRAALGPAQKLLDDWTTRYGPGDPLRLRLAGQLANLHRALGEHQSALRLDDAALAENRRALPHNHPQTLVSARGRGGSLRGLGLFRDALEEDRGTWEGLREAFGDDHRQTQMAAKNLASSLFLAGEPYEALAMAVDNHRRRLRLFGEHDPGTWLALSAVGVYRRELGDYDGAFEVLKTARQRLQKSGLSRSELTVRWHQAVALRCQGRSLAAKERTGQALRDLRLVLGPHHPNTLACQVSFAAAHRAVGVDPAQTLEVAASAHNLLRDETSLPGDHPFIALARLAVGLATIAAGGSGVDDTAEAADQLRDRLGEVHPWALAATVDHARALAAAGDPGATPLFETTYEECVEYLGQRHPHTVIAAHNLRVAAEERGDWREIDVDIPET